jgi:formylglycine-generating enzyme required for sulfatase activity
MSDDSLLGTPATRPPAPGEEQRPAEPRVGDRLGCYLLNEILGHGGMGRVFRAFDETLRRDVAIKVMLPEIARDPKHRRRFLREARAMAALNHVNVVSIHHVDDAGPVPFFVMPLLRGETLHARQLRERVLPVRDVVRIARQTGEGLAHAHEHPLKLVHRDVKPLNLWLEEGTGDVKVLDFGLVRLDQESTNLTQPGQVFGTPDFMAPEQWGGAGVDHRCDQYALGCVLYLACTARMPRGRFRDPNALNRDVPQELSDLIVRLLSQEPEGRYPSMREVVRELARVKSSGPPVSPASLPLPLPSVPGQGKGMEVRAQPAAASVPMAVKERLSRTFTNAIGMRFVLVEPGTFLMGSPKDETGRSDAEKQHQVTITRPFYLGVHQVTQGQWKAAMGDNPAYFSRGGGGEDRVREVSDADLDQFPVEMVSWEDAQGFLKRLAALDEEVKNGRQYRLPTEAEWEWSCRAGATTAYSFGYDPRPLGDYAWYAANSREQTHPVGRQRPNVFGLHDMHGNVWEWCLDWEGEYPSAPATDPLGPSHGSGRVSRGGSWVSSGQDCRAAVRHVNAPRHRRYYLGLRAVAVPHE